MQKLFSNKMISIIHKVCLGLTICLGIAAIIFPNVCGGFYDSVPSLDLCYDLKLHYLWWYVFANSASELKTVLVVMSLRILFLYTIVYLIVTRKVKKSLFEKILIILAILSLIVIFIVRSTPSA